MAERDSWATQASGPTGTLDVEDSRLAIAALAMPGSTRLKAKSGFRPGPGTSPGLVTATGTPDGFVHVAPFQLLLQGGRASEPGTYLACLDAIKDINILSTAADPTNPRNDLIIAQQSDTFYSDANSNFVVKQVVGTPAGSPVDPTVTGSTDYVTLARVRVDAGVTTIVSAKITDLRTSGHAKSLTGGLYTVALGGTLPVASQTERDAVAGVYPGLTAFRSDSKRHEIYESTRWSPMPGALLARGRRTTNVTSTSAENGIMRFDDVPILGGHIYWIFSTTLNLSPSVAGLTAQVTARITTDGSTPDNTKTQIGTALIEATATNVPRGSSSLRTEYLPVSDETLSVFFGWQLIGGTGTATLTGSTTSPIAFYLVDMGTDPGVGFATNL